jgi:hypothetical protein
MRLRSGADGIRTWDDPPVRLAGGEAGCGSSTRNPLDRLTYAAAAAAISWAHTRSTTSHTAHVAPDDVIVGSGSRLVVEDALARGDAALRSFTRR